MLFVSCSCQQRQRKNDQVYQVSVNHFHLNVVQLSLVGRLMNKFVFLQGLSSATRDTYQSLQMQPIAAR